MCSSSASPHETARNGRVAMWLLGVKLGYLGLVYVTTALWPQYDEQLADSINARWFQQGTPSSGDGAPGLARHFATWDAQHYLLLSESGYARGVKSDAFYPLWPLAMRWFSVATGGSHLVAGVVLANVFSLIAWVLFHHNVAERFGGLVARLALVFLICFPGALFFQFVYSESLFLLLVMILWFGLEKDRLGWAWLAAFLLPLCRAVGVFSLLPIVWWWLARRDWEGFELRAPNLVRKVLPTSRAAASPQSSPPLRLKRRNAGWREHALLAAVPSGLTLYFVLMWVWTGNPFEGMEAQKHWRVHSVGNLWDVPGFIVSFFEPTTWHGFRGSALDRCLFLLLLYCLPLVWRLGSDLVLWTYVLGIIPAMSGHFTSYTRFGCCVFPVFIALAVFVEGRQRCWLKWALLSGFGLGHAVLAWRFLNFGWTG